MRLTPFLFLMLLAVNAWSEAWTLTFDLTRGQGSGRGGRHVTYHSDGRVESSQYQNGETGSNPSGGKGKLDERRLETLEKAVSDPELLRQKNFGAGEITVTLVKDGKNKSFSATGVEKFPGPAGKLLRTILKVQGEPGF